MAKRNSFFGRRRESSRNRRRVLGKPLSQRAERLEDRLMLASVTFTSPTSNAGDGTWSSQVRDGESVAVGPAYLYYNFNPAAALPGFQQGDTLYARVDYFDEGAGTVRFQYDSTLANFDQTEFHTRSTRIDTQQFVSSYHYLDNVQFAGGTNGSDFRVAAWGAPVQSVTISDEPFAESGLEWVDAPPWELPYSGQSYPVDASTLNGKTLTGYQGWFNTPNDAADEGYVHWGVPGDWSIDQWPDPNDYDQSELFPVPGVTTASGDQAYLFSSANGSVVDRHFQWMREHDIDGVFLQRFAESFMRPDGSGGHTGEPQWPLVNARDAAHRSGRTWAIEYDIQNGGTSAQRDQRIQEVKDDWEFLTDPNGLDMLNDSHYQHEGGKPVVAIFGLYVNPGNTYSDAQQQDLISYFQSRGVYVIGAGRHSEAQSQLANAALHDAYIPWQGYWKGGDSYAPDELRLEGVTTHIPHVFPGFSWTHLQDSASATSRDREDGAFYWRMLADAANETDAPWWFIGMFDEYDEATNLIPATDDPPVPDTDSLGNPLTYQVSDPAPNDWWMALTGAAKQALQNKAAINDSLPSEAELQNRSNIGGEARWTADAADRLENVPASDSAVETVVVPVNGQDSLAIRSLDPYLYFAIDDTYLGQEDDGRDITIEVEYLDLISGQFSLEYDATTDPYASTTPATMTGSGEWRTHRFELSDAYFGNRQNSDADLRLVTPGGNLFVRRVSVIKESVLSVETDLGSTDDESGLGRVELSGDGQTQVVTTDGREARQLSGTPSSLYMYFAVDDTYASAVEAGLNAVVEVVYRDVGNGQLQLQYDATSAAYKNTAAVQVGNTGEWLTTRFYLDDAYFGNRQNGGADFRLVGSNVPIDQVRVLRSFGDLIAPEATLGEVFVDTPGNRLIANWSMTDDWRSGNADAWTVQEDNAYVVEVSGDGGVSWAQVETGYEGASVTSVSTYDPLSGVHVWNDAVVVSTSDFESGFYRLRLTPVDGRGNKGEAVTTESFAVFASPELPGDYNLDGTVNAADYTTWRDSLGSATTPYTGADGNGDGLVGQEDYDLWKSSFGASSSSSLNLAFAKADTRAQSPIVLTASDLDALAGSLVAEPSASETGDETALEDALASMVQQQKTRRSTPGAIDRAPQSANTTGEEALLLVQPQQSADRQADDSPGTSKEPDEKQREERRGSIFARFAKLRLGVRGE